MAAEHVDRAAQSTSFDEANWAATSSAELTTDDIETLRDILFRKYRDRIVELEAKIDKLEHRLGDEDAVAAMITPSLAEATRRRISRDREMMIEVTYPIIAPSVSRAVSEAMQNLARRIDEQLQSIRAQFQRNWLARFLGRSNAEIILRESLPFELVEIYLIYRENGLLLWHFSNNPDLLTDSDIVGGMLTAVQDFVKDSFGRGQEGDLDEIQYGERRILLEVAEYVSLAVVIDGIEPPDFRNEMRTRLIEFNYLNNDILRSYDGDPSPLVAVDDVFGSLDTPSEPKGLNPNQQRIFRIILIVGLLGIFTLCAGASWWVWRVSSILLL